MSEINELVQINFNDVFISVLIIFVSFKFIISLFDWFVNLLGIETKCTRQKREEHGLLIKTSEELNMLKDKHEKSVIESAKNNNDIKIRMTQLFEKVDTLAESLQEMKNIQDEDKRSEYKDRISQSYRYYISRTYSEDEPVPYWNHMEKDALRGLVTQYEAHGGTNSFVHSIVEPEMEKWKVIG